MTQTPILTKCCGDRLSFHFSPLEFDVAVDHPALLDLGHLPDAGDGAEGLGQEEGRGGPWVLAVEVALQHPGVLLLERLYSGYIEVTEVI